MTLRTDPRVIIIGLGYVGLPLAIALARKVETIGVDVSPDRIAELRAGHDRTGEIDPEVLRESTLTLSSDLASCPAGDIYIVTVPTPVDADKQPDLSLVRRATDAVGRVLDGSRTPIIVYESTVYPGVTEDVCGPMLEQASGLKRGVDFFLGYSPERINPGDREHSIDRITKIVAGENDAVADQLEWLYGSITTGGTYRAVSIMAAEAAKVIENAQRDINIGFMNEIARIFGKLDLSIWDVLDAAGTKWNFLKFQPGLVGGHCIGVDPYYLSYRAEQLGHDPAVILAGRAINDGMADWVADQVNERITARSDILVLGLTFKENVPDLRNSKVNDLIVRLRSHGHEVTVHDPLADGIEAQHEYGLVLDPAAMDRRYDSVVLAVPHHHYRDNPALVDACLRDRGLLADLKGCLRGRPRSDSYRYWTL